VFVADGLVASHMSRTELLVVVEALTHGTINGSTVLARGIELDVRSNEARDSRQPTGDFLDAPSTVEVIADDALISLESYNRFVAMLMQGLHARGLSIVVASKWEDQLPGRGRLENL
jgi:hypothetical protein